MNNFKYKDELEFFIQLRNKTALKEIDARNTVTCLNEDNIQLRKVHVNNFKYKDELEFFIQLRNKTALKEIDARNTVTS